jgi:hypothetical protein
MLKFLSFTLKHCLHFSLELIVKDKTTISTAFLQLNLEFATPYNILKGIRFKISFMMPTQS